MRPIRISILCLLLSLTASAQQKDSFFRDLNDFLNMREDKSYAQLDSNYIGRYPYHWDARLFVKSSGLHIVVDGKNSGHLTTGMSNRAGIGLSYRGVGLSYSRALGKTLNLDMTLDSYGKHFCFEYALRATNELEGDLTRPAENELEVNNDVVLISNKLNVFYSFNNRFSYAAAMKQTQIQKRSAGSFIAGVSWSVWDILILNDDLADLTPRHITSQFYQANILYNRISLGVGYGYNLVMGHAHWLLHASVVPMWSIFESESSYIRENHRVSNYPYGSISFAGTGRAGVYYRWGTRWSIGFSGIINQMMSRSNIKSKANDFTSFNAQEWQMKLSLGMRF